MPFHPHQLGVIGRYDNIPDGVAPPHDMERDRCRVVRGKAPACPQTDGSDHIRIHPVFHIRRLDFPARFFGLFKPDNADPKGADDIPVGLYPAPAAGPGGKAQVAVLQEQGKGKVLESHRGQLTPQGPSGKLVVEGGFRCRKSVFCPIEGHIGNGLQQDLILPCQHVFVADTCGIGYHHAGVFRTEIAFDGFDGSGPAVAVDDGRHGIGRLQAVVRDAGLQGERSPVPVLDLVHLAKMEHRGCLASVGEIHRRAHGGAGLGIHHRHPHAIVAGRPEVGGGALVHVSPAAVNVALPGSESLCRAQAEQEGGAEEGIKAFQTISHSNLFL